MINLSCFFKGHSFERFELSRTKPYMMYIPDAISAYVEGHFEKVYDINYISQCSKCGMIVKDTVTTTLEIFKDD